MFWSRLKEVFGRASPIERALPGELEWRQALAAVPILQGFSGEEEQTLIELARHFLARKTLTQIGVELSPRQQGVLALQAVLPILHLGLEWYRGFHEVIIIPEPVTRRQEVQDEFGLVSEVEEENAGESWPQGPLVLAWSELQQDGDWDGFNLVIHELAHKLDMLGGAADGAPPLPGGMDPRQWTRALQSAFDEMNDQLARGEVTEIDPYAASHPAEFFAVCSESFFTEPLRLRDVYPAVYEQFCRFYGQEPATRFPATRLLAGEAEPRG
ncbi:MULTISPECIES: M90 family metallopeptidase [Aeromonas]|uniref:Zinc-dependent peptidase n=1 Tax=Aeromonas sanarellii TaxID=633415 RepID=A0ABS4B1J2_9GAMM|nr:MULTISPECIES: M90 family metallopeptidase [Aeromonas]MBP0601348.1 zinc-dependent peptidase [Aeromonas sanarellii]MEB6605976.1 zinc-dependent peptidase [Aeromonas sanarellii]QXC29345.1 zinc-dependent peptidase [Aeromonas sp. FDAARGOS 1409]WOX50129.1 zinc-dependent peptidase [Aeromonas sp. XH]